jgi:hypothetical protein
MDGMHTGGGVAMVPAAAGNRAYVMTNGGRLLGVHIAPPKLLERTATDAGLRL